MGKVRLLRRGLNRGPSGWSPKSPPDTGPNRLLVRGGSDDTSFAVWKNSKQELFSRKQSTPLATAVEAGTFLDVEGVFQLGLPARMTSSLARLERSPDF